VIEPVRKSMANDPKINSSLPQANRRKLVVVASPAFAHKAFNPYQSLLYEAMQRQGAVVLEYNPRQILFGSYDVVHIHWPEGHFLTSSGWSTLLRASRFFIVMMLVRAKGARIVWTAHNLQSHAQCHPRLERIGWRLFYHYLAGIISLNRAIKEELEQKRLRNLKIPVVEIPHGHYRGFYPDTVNPSEARTRLGIPNETNLVFAWIGQIKAYKGLLELVTAWRSWPETGVSLLIAGQAKDPQLKQSLAEATAQDKRICYHSGWLEDGKMQYFLRAAHVLVLPYRAISNSGSALLGLSFNIPVVLPRSAPTEELQESVGKEWIYLYDNPFSASVLNDVRRWLKEEPRGPVAPLDALDWDRLADQTLTFFEQICR
jgi:beta-1,4-mannosyltransferase